MAVQMYNIPAILPDLRKEESYRQIVDALEYLDAVANDVFNRIGHRIGENKDHLVQLNTRINVAQAKIDKLRSSSTKATRVFAPPKYPAPAAMGEYRTVFQDVNPLLQRVRKTKAAFTSRMPDVTAEVIRAKKDPFVLSLDSREKRIEVKNPEEGEGLGRLPRHLPSLSSLLLFNSTENPYKKYVLLDPLAGAKTKTRTQVIDNENALSEAPVTIQQGEQLDSRTKDSLMYMPKMAELPELDVPNILPALPNVADDLFYTADVGKSIAPSMANTTLPSLPSLADPSAPAALAAPPSVSSPPPPPPPPPSGAPPPPPPPPPPGPGPSPAAQQATSNGEGDGGASSGTPPEGVPEEAGGNDRADLMAAIRNAGGTKALNKGKDRKQERKAKKEEEAEKAQQGGGDLLSDLSAVLGRRRKAISGGRDNKKDDSHNLGGPSIMDNMSKLIPPPPAPKPAKKNDEDGDDDSADEDTDKEEWQG